ncbi:hypothetical protein BZL29_1019 [Mycobacterium kansasii]|uniref:Uncharacterized protein n=1 Tax=Mycobacterium kansasii TaxID=1768 RepID=A0A1V3XVC7_MYCKA|nr:hypothetical protein BZL29_1019 [Mycobacterium kansasii]
MFSALMTEEALEGKVASTVHFDMRKVNPTPKMPPLVPGDPEAATPGYSWADFHSSAEARRVLAHLADTAPGDRKVDIFIEHEDGISIIRKGSGAVEGAPLPQRLAKFVPNLNNSGTRGSGGGTGPPPPAAVRRAGLQGRRFARRTQPRPASRRRGRRRRPGRDPRRRRNRSRRG